MFSCPFRFRFNASFAVLIMTVLAFSDIAISEVGKSMTFISSEEIQISTREMDCDYYLEDYRRHGTGFAYPQLLLIGNESPIVAFVDAKAEQLVFATVAAGSAKIENSVAAFGKYDWAKWPMIFVKDGKIQMAVQVESPALKRGQYQIRFYELDRENNLARLKLDKLFTINGKHIVLSGAYPFKSDYLVTGYFSDYYFGIGWISGHPPVFKKNISITLDDKDVFDRQLIEEEGRFGLWQREYAVSDSGVAHSVWVRTTKYILAEHDVTVCHSESRDGKTWSKPLELYKLKDTDFMWQISNISLTSNSNSAFLLWQDVKSGFYFGEVINGVKQEIVKLSDMTPTASRQIEPLFGAQTVKIAVDEKGNIYTLWVMNKGISSHGVFMKARINGKWTDTILVHRGNGIIYLPDMKVDQQGTVHITYIKYLNARMPGEKAGCYYIKLERDRKE